LRLLAGSGPGGLLAIDTLSTEARKGGKRKGKGNGKGKSKKVTICHKGQTVTVSKSALKTHQKHGDTTGACQIQDLSPAADATCQAVAAARR
jgi:hypothetical protein